MEFPLKENEDEAVEASHPLPPFFLVFSVNNFYFLFNKKMGLSIGKKANS